VKKVKFYKFKKAIKTIKNSKMHRQRQKSPQFNPTLLSLILILTFMNQILASTSLQSLHQHRHRHKHQIFTVDSEQMHEIREAFDEYRNTINKPNKIDFEELKPLRHHHKKHNHHHQQQHDETHEIDNNSIQEDETMPAIHQHQIGLNVMNRHKRLNGGKTTTTSAPTTTTSTTTVKTIDNYDDEYDDEESDTNRRVSDDAHVQTRSSQVRMRKKHVFHLFYG
jgi:hypothetical protein